jgi:hypothetical protein
MLLKLSLEWLVKTSLHDIQFIQGIGQIIPVSLVIS